MCLYLDLFAVDRVEVPGLALLLDLPSGQLVLVMATSSREIAYLASARDLETLQTTYRVDARDLIRKSGIGPCTVPVAHRT